MEHPDYKMYVKEIEIVDLNDYHEFAPEKSSIMVKVTDCHNREWVFSTKSSYHDVGCIIPELALDEDGSDGYEYVAKTIGDDYADLIAEGIASVSNIQEVWEEYIKNNYEENDDPTEVHMDGRSERGQLKRKEAQSCFYSA